MTQKQSAPVVPPLTQEQTNELIDKLLECIAELEDRLHQHSGNSSRPPSSDGPEPARKRPASGKQRGARPGHKGHRRERHPLDARLTLVPHYPATDCACCGGDMVVHAKPYQVHQAFEQPEVNSTNRRTCPLKTDITIWGLQVNRATLFFYVKSQSIDFKLYFLSL